MIADDADAMPFWDKVRSEPDEGAAYERKMTRQNGRPVHLTLVMCRPIPNPLNASRDALGLETKNKWLSCRWRTRATRCTTTNGKISKPSRDHNHVHLGGDVSSFW